MRVRHRLSRTKWLPVQILLHKYIELPILYNYFGIFYCESEIKYMYSENVYSKIMSQGQKRPQNSSDCSISGGGPPDPPSGARSIYFLPHIQGGRSTPLCLFIFGTSAFRPLLLLLLKLY